MNSDPLLQRMKILIVDDEPANVALLQEILFENGYARVESVCDSKVVLEMCKKFQPDLILLDLMMPPPDGFAIHLMPVNTSACVRWFWKERRSRSGYAMSRNQNRAWDSSLSASMPAPFAGLIFILLMANFLIRNYR